ncbi:hypothetical protein SDC9_157319 [bioreactor metagenome]|uniref:Uncharacterized protein n=1 Tax=bioreactor metagenome TaxID=1076179 RepID=A0A645F8S4_9ZZZZ
MFHQAFNGNIRVFRIGQTCIDHFCHVVWRHIGRHTYCNTGYTVNQQVRNTCRHDLWNAFRTVVVVFPLDCVFFQIGQKLMGQLTHTHFGITHCCCTIAINRTEVTLTIYQLITQAEVLRHTNNGFINSRVTMWVIFTDHVTDDTG